MYTYLYLYTYIHIYIYMYVYNVDIYMLQARACTIPITPHCSTPIKF